MKRILFLLALIGLLPARPAAARHEMVIDDKHVADYLYVASAQSGRVDGDRLVLKGVAAVTFFSDRPNRVAGHLSLEGFAEVMKARRPLLRADPPNATLSILSPNGNRNVVVELMDPELEDGVLSFRFRVLDGELPDAFGPASLFIDAYPTAVNNQIT